MRRRHRFELSFRECVLCDRASVRASSGTARKILTKSYTNILYHGQMNWLDFEGRGSRSRSLQGQIFEWVIAAGTRSTSRPATFFCSKPDCRPGCRKDPSSGIWLYMINYLECQVYNVCLVECLVCCALVLQEQKLSYCRLRKFFHTEP